MKDQEVINKSTVLYLMGLASLLSCQKEETKADKPLNIVYIMSDDHAQQMISCYDSPYIETPNIDKLAKDGVRFTESFVANSLSGPSRACMLTGKHSHLNGKKNNEHSSQFDQNQQTMPKLLQTGGYQTALFGKLHLDGIPQGFDKWFMLPGQGDYYDPHFITPSEDGAKLDTLQVQGYVTDIITDKSLEWLEHERDKSKPFALFIHHKATHRNWMADTKDLEAFEDQEFPLPETFYDDYEGRLAAQKQEMHIYKDMDLVYDLKMLKKGIQPKGLGGYYSWNKDKQGIHGRLRPEVKARFDSLYYPIADKFYKKNLEGKALAEWKYQRYMRDYAKVVKSLDRNVGRVIDYLREHDMLDNTLIVYTSDQGFYMGEHGWFDKRFMYEESMRTPLVMHLPKSLKKRGDIKELVQNIDYAPTFLDMAGLNVPQDMQGESLLPLLKEDKEVTDWQRQSLYYHFYEYPGEHQVRRHYGIRTKEYKLIHFYGDLDAWELYDLKNDPKELKNLYNKPEYQTIVEELKTQLDSLRTHYQVSEPSE